MQYQYGSMDQTLHVPCVSQQTFPVGGCTHVHWPNPMHSHRNINNFVQSIVFIPEHLSTTPSMSDTSRNPYSSFTPFELMTGNNDCTNHNPYSTRLMMTTTTYTVAKYVRLLSLSVCSKSLMRRCVDAFPFAVFKRCFESRSNAIQSCNFTFLKFSSSESRIRALQSCSGSG